MFRCVVSLLLLPCLLLPQAAAFGHTHGGLTPAGHGFRPHVHTNPVSARTDHGHHHGPDGTHHHHHHDGEDAPEPDTQPAPLSDHDTDALFIDSIDVVIGQRCSANELPASVILLAVGPSGVFFWEVHLSWFPHWTHPPPLSGCSCPLYVLHRALLN